MKNVQKSWQLGCGRSDQQQAAHCSKIHVCFYGSAVMTRSLPLLLFRVPSLLVFVSAILPLLHPFTHKQPRNLDYFTITCGENCFPASWWAFQCGLVPSVLVSTVPSFTAFSCLSTDAGRNAPVSTHYIPIWEVLLQWMLHWLIL